MKTKLTSIPLVALLVLAGCSSGSSTQPEQTGGHGGSGSGGTTQAGGSSGQGGTKSTGGSSGSGGTVAAGGSGAGGVSSSGGKSGTGGAGGGGVPGTGGASATGGGVAGGTTAQGGTTASGGGAGSGGVGATGGSTAKGGADGGVGGKTGTGGSGATTGAGGNTAVAACGLPPGPNSGVAAPTGAATKIDVLPWAGFKAATSFSLDDGNTSQISNYATLNALGVKFTFYLVTGWKSADDAIWKQAIKDGHEIGNHTQSHSCGTASAGESDIKSKFGLTAYTMAAPGGDTSCGSSVDSLNLLLNRGVNGGSVSFTADDTTVSKNLPTSLPPPGASASSLTSVIDGAYSKGEWQTFCIHGFSDPPGDGSAYQPFLLASLTDAVKTEQAKKDLWIDTMQAVGAYWRAGRTFAKATATTSGTDKTWTWTVPKNNPPNTCLRVKSDGGVVKQRGAVIPWNDHGYYEISFDAGEVTLSAL